MTGQVEFVAISLFLSQLLIGLLKNLSKNFVWVAVTGFHWSYFYLYGEEVILVSMDLAFLVVLCLEKGCAFFLWIKMVRKQSMYVSSL